MIALLLRIIFMRVPSTFMHLHAHHEEWLRNHPGAPMRVPKAPMSPNAHGRTLVGARLPAQI